MLLVFITYLQSLWHWERWTNGRFDVTLTSPNKLHERIKQKLDRKEKQKQKHCFIIPASNYRIQTWLYTHGTLSGQAVKTPALKYWSRLVRISPEQHGFVFPQDLEGAEYTVLITHWCTGKIKAAKLVVIPDLHYYIN